MPKTKDIARKDLYENYGKYINSDYSDIFLRNKTIDSPSYSEEKIGIVGKKDDVGYKILMEIATENNLRFNNTFETLSDIRKAISKEDDQYKAGISYVIRLDYDSKKNKYQLNVLKGDFINGFSPFNLDNTSPVDFWADRYVGYNQFHGDDNYLANFASLIAEKIAAKQNKPLKIVSGYLQRSSEPYKDSVLAQVMDQMYPIFMVVIFILPYMYILQRAVEEKATKTRESMRMMGMIDSAYWTSWFLLYLGMVLMISIILTVGSIFTLFPG